MSVFWGTLELIDLIFFWFFWPAQVFLIVEKNMYQYYFLYNWKYNSTYRCLLLIRCYV
jgi:hypothetical protein